VQQMQQSMDPFTMPTPPQVESVASSNPFRTMPQPLQPSVPETAVSPSLVSSRTENTNPAALVQTYMDRMSKMMMAMDERMTRLETLMSHNLFLLHQQTVTAQQQQQQPKKTQEEDLEKALKEQVKLELEHARKMQAQFEQDGEIAKKIQEQMDNEYFTEERKKFYTQPQTTLSPRPAFTPARRPMPGFEECPVCLGHVNKSELEAHVYACLDGDKNIDASGKPKVDTADKPGFLARLFGPKKEVSEERVSLVSQAQPIGGMEYPGHPGGMYPGISYPPMYPMPSSPYMHPAQAPPPVYYYVPQPHHGQ